MSSFATEFPTGCQNSIQEFVSAVRIWILGSRYTRLSEDELELAELTGKRSWSIEKDDERIDILILRSGDEEAAGIQYDNKDSRNILWTTSIVFDKNKTDAWVRVQVSRQSEGPAANLPPAKKPVAVKTLMDELGGASDGMLRVSDTPHRLGNVDVDSAAQLITGKADCHLPIVYVSAGFHGVHSVDCTRLASDLSGMAHVIVEPNRNFSLRLKIEVDSENVYGGTVGVYWPDAAGRRSFFVGRGLESPEDVRRAVVDEVTKALAHRRALERCTWSRIREAASHQRLAELRASGSLELNEYIENFDNEIKAKKQQLEDAENEISRLKRELRRWERERRGFNSRGLLQGGGEQDLYPGEIRGIVRAAIEDARRRVVCPDGRRDHVLSAILSANPCEDVAKSKQEDLKIILKEARGMDHKTRKSLEDMGFKISEGGKHYKLVFGGDDRYTYTLQKTGSDWRGGMNTATNIGRNLF